MKHSDTHEPLACDAPQPRDTTVVRIPAVNSKKPLLRLSLLSSLAAQTASLFISLQPNPLACTVVARESLFFSVGELLIFIVRSMVAGASPPRDVTPVEGT